MDLALCEEAIDFENLNTGVFQLLKHVFIHWFNRTESYRTIRKRTWRYLSSFILLFAAVRPHLKIQRKQRS